MRRQLLEFQNAGRLRCGSCHDRLEPSVDLVENPVRKPFTFGDLESGKDGQPDAAKKEGGRRGATEPPARSRRPADPLSGSARNGSAFGVDIAYSVEETILGTAGGARRMSPFLDCTFVLVYGDVLTDLDLTTLVAFHRQHTAGPHLTMTLYRVPNPSECGIVSLDERGKVIRFVEKPAIDDVFSDLAHAGVSVMDPELLQFIPPGRFYDFGRDLFPRLLQSGVPIYGWPLPDKAYLIDIGTPEKYARAQQEWPTQTARTLLAQGGTQ